MTVSKFTSIMVTCKFLLCMTLVWTNGLLISIGINETRCWFLTSITETYSSLQASRGQFDLFQFYWFSMELLIMELCCHCCLPCVNSLALADAYLHQKLQYSSCYFFLDSNLLANSPPPPNNAETFSSDLLFLNCDQDTYRAAHTAVSWWRFSKVTSNLVNISVKFIYWPTFTDLSGYIW